MASTLLVSSCPAARMSLTTGGRPGRACGKVQCPGDELAVPKEQRGRGDEERRPLSPGQQPRQCGQHDPIFGPQIRSGHLPVQHRDLMAEHEQFDVFGAAVAGELGQHLQHLPQQ